MDERKFANFFEVVELIDEILPPKSVVDYTKISVEELVNKFDSIISSSGYYFKEEELVSARKAIREYQRYIEGKQSVFIGNRPGEGFDQNNYLVQNYLSNMKNSLIIILGHTKDLIIPGRIISTRLLGSIDELKSKMTKEKIKDYVTSVLTTTWERGDTIRIEEYSLATDILLHFGISTKQEYVGENLLSTIASDISRMEIASRDFHGPISSEGYYNSSTTNSARYPKTLAETIEKITERIYSSLKSTIEQTERHDERLSKIFTDRQAQKKEPARTLAKEPPKVQTPQKPTIESLMAKSTDLRDPEIEPESEEEVSIDTLEALKAKYDEKQALLKKNMEIEEELLKARLERERIEQRITKLEREKQENDEKIKKGL